MSANHPGRDPSFIYSRRIFWRALLQEALVVSGMLKGGQECRLDELGSLSDDQLARIKPIVHPACEIFVDQDYVWSRCKGADLVVKLFSMSETENWVALGMFDGQHNLGEVGARLSQAMDWDASQGFAHAKDLFLSLASRLICIPKDPLEPMG